MVVQLLTAINIENHWLTPVRRVRSENFNQRPSTEISLLVIHFISLPAGQFATPYVDQLFTNVLDTQAHPTFADLENLRVSTHLFINRQGAVTQYVAFDQRAWHAGESSFQGRVNCNDFAIGIELEGTDTIPFTLAQYATLASLTQLLMKTYPSITTDRVVGHSDIAPGRKIDPGPYFNWSRFRASIALKQTRQCLLD